MPDGECIVLGCPNPAPFTWFCPRHTDIKTAAYAESARLGENFDEVIDRRDRMLAESMEPD